MERLTIDIPESKSAEIKEFLKSMGFSASNPKVVKEYKKNYYLLVFGLMKI